MLGLCGENGAGKSTLMKILFGMDVIRETGGYGGAFLYKVCALYHSRRRKSRPVKRCRISPPIFGLVTVPVRAYIAPSEKPKGTPLPGAATS